MLKIWWKVDKRLPNGMIVSVLLAEFDYEIVYSLRVIDDSWGGEVIESGVGFLQFVENQVRGETKIIRNK